MVGYLDWDTEALPLLQAAYELSGARNGFADIGEVDVMELNRKLGREPGNDQTTALLSRLASGDYISVVDVGVDQVDGARLIALNDKALQFVAAWPSSTGDAALQRLLTLLDERIETERDPVEKGKLVRLRDGLVNVGKEVAGGMLTHVLTGGA